MSLVRLVVGETGVQCRSIAPCKTVAASPKHNAIRESACSQTKDLEPMSFIGTSKRSYPGYRRWLTKTCRRVWFTLRVVEDVEIETSDHQIDRRGIGLHCLSLIKEVPHTEHCIPGLSLRQS